MKLLTVEQIIAIHAQVLGIRSVEGLRPLGIDRLEVAVAAQTQHAFGMEFYSDVYLKAAAMIKTILAGHPFHDGNKRTAMLVGLTFLVENGYQFQAEKGEIEDFAVKIATDHLEISDIAIWLQAHVGDTIQS